MKLVEYTDSEILWMDLANRVAGELNGALMTHERATLAVPGGTTPGPLFDVLSSVALDWDRVDLLLTDERWVPEDSPQSNARLLRERLLVGKAAAARFVPYYTGGAAPDHGLLGIAADIRALCPLSIVLLGMGTDMHTASLFPGAEGLAEALGEAAPALVPIRLPGAEAPRVTLSAEVLNGALQKHLVILGPEKRESLEKAVAIGDPSRAPVAAVLEGLTVHWAQS